jgi:hypothetical protein
MPEPLRKMLSKPSEQASALLAMRRKISGVPVLRLPRMASSYIKTHSPEQAKELVDLFTVTGIHSFNEKLFINHVKRGLREPVQRSAPQNSVGSLGAKFYPTFRRWQRQASEGTRRIDARNARMLGVDPVRNSPNKQPTRKSMAEEDLVGKDQRVLGLLPVFRALTQDETPRPINEGVAERKARKQAFLRELDLLERNQRHPS